MIHVANKAVSGLRRCGQRRGEGWVPQGNSLSTRWFERERNPGNVKPSNGRPLGSRWTTTKCRWEPSGYYSP